MFFAKRPQIPAYSPKSTCFHQSRFISHFSSEIRIAGNTRGDQPSREHTRGRPAKSGGHSWETTREATESGAHSWGATRPEITLPPGASREILGETSQVGSTLVEDKPSRGDTRGANSGTCFSSRFGDGPGRGRASVLVRKTIENSLSHPLLGEKPLGP